MKKRILAVEQSYLIQDIILKALKFSGEGAEVIPARTAKEAMGYLSMRDHTQLPSLIILSTELPDTNGYMLARLIKENTATGHIPIVMISSRDNEVDIDRAFECGVNDYIVKGPELRYLPDKVKALFDTYERKSEELILVADDSVLIVNLIRFALEQRGYKVNTALDGESAYERALLLGPSLIILDLVMPKVDGFTFLEKLRAEPSTKEIPVIVLTGFSGKRELDRLPAFHVARVLKKPFDNVTLALEVDDILDHRHPKNGSEVRVEVSEES
ncbi:MAG: response regulator [Candidatus Wallbacteria bacterium]|nr:response regulator [Candidatus Wallbacteria bacterium]